MTFINVKHWYSDAPLEKHGNERMYQNEISAIVKIKPTRSNKHFDCYTYDDEHIDEVPIDLLISIAPNSIAKNLSVKLNEEEIICQRIKPTGNRNGLICVNEKDNKKISVKNIKSITTTN